jgi:AraC-like DNA-binding protein
MQRRRNSSAPTELRRELLPYRGSIYPPKGKNVRRKRATKHALFYSTDTRIRRVVALIEERFDRKLSLAYMARIAGLSSSRLRHKFKSEIGVTPTVYLQTYRLRVAKALIANKGLRVKEAKAAVGISSDSYFTRQFKRAFGVTPTNSKSF